ncbi:MAG TPA: four helix bundle protein [Chitinophagaceae bacterium]|nr:four helix bundle protein [Chitinophagaceae bacterium]
MVLRFEDLIVWQKSQDLACNIYKLFAHIKDYSFKDQICSATVSISSNIAEGFDKSSTKEYLQFLEISGTSANEVKSLLYLSSRLKFISAGGSAKFVRKDRGNYKNDCWANQIFRKKTTRYWNAPYHIQLISYH